MTIETPSPDGRMLAEKFEVYARQPGSKQPAGEVTKP